MRLASLVAVAALLAATTASAQAPPGPVRTFGARDLFGLQMATDPQVLLLDEPTAGVDPAARRLFWQTIYELARNGTTILVTTHYMDEAEILCDRVAIIDTGRIISLASPDKLIDDLVATGFERPKEVKKALVRQTNQGFFVG